jgi:hypothetical protein
MTGTSNNILPIRKINDILFFRKWNNIKTYWWIQ